MKFPDNAKLVFDGEIFKVYQWQQKLYDGSYATFEGIARPDTVGIIAEKDGKIIYTKQSQPNREKQFLSLLGGRADGDETPLEAAKREMLEESGLASDDWELLFKFELISKMDWTIYAYVARNCYQAAEPNPDKGEKIELVATDVDDFLLNVITHPDFRDAELKYRIFTEPNQKNINKIKNKLLNRK